MEARENERVEHCVNKALGTSAVCVVNVIRNQQTAVRVEAHARSESLFFAGQQYQIRKHLVPKNLSSPCGGIRPMDRPLTGGELLHCKAIFQLLDFLEEFAPFPG